MPSHHVNLLQPRQVFDSAFMGLTTRDDHPLPIAIYDYQACVDAVAQWHEISQLAAVKLVHSTVLSRCGSPSGPLLFYRLGDFDPLPAAASQELPLAA